eukprot:TRINITY_DN12112_c0_g1_i1.p1 TRINITY_DN12112_c0_g1~~TRINITY_DN12112_c0_g1_i1.p1  ORF type:complete len:359 (+),score=91.81 TRINITY_DN12112_c0_g1_i1:59-1135(+)
MPPRKKARPPARAADAGSGSSSSSETEGSGPQNPLAQRRAQNIARLAQLGVSLGITEAREALRACAPKPAPRPKKRPRPPTEEPEERPPSERQQRMEELRRESERRRQKEWKREEAERLWRKRKRRRSPSTEPSSSDESGTGSSSSAAVVALSPQEQAREREKRWARRAAARGAPEPPSQPSGEFCRNLDAAVAELHRKYLGKAFPETGKACVMARAARPARPPRFSKYCGLLEWRNVLMLWVNIGSDKATYPNVFTKHADGVLRMSWFASAAQSADSRPVQRLLAATRGPLKAPGEDRDCALLFCRLEGRPYVYCGRVVMDQYVPASHPLEFSWKLMDVAGLRCKALNEVVSAALVV